jgi:hydrogenase nickel incorporation protein HypA/HybF
MHELGLVTHIVRTIEDISKEEQLTNVSSVTLELGEVSGVIPDYLTDCWKYFRVKSEILMEADLKIFMIPAVTICEDCNQTYSTLKYKKICPHCGSGSTYLKTGNEFNIKEIEAC